MRAQRIVLSSFVACLVAGAVFAGGTEVTSFVSPLAIAKGGLGVTTAPTDGQVPIGQSSDGSYAPAAVTAGAGIAITNGGHSLTIATTGANPIVANARQTGQTAADSSITTYTVGGSDTTFEVECNVNITTSTTYSFTATCAYTDEGNNARTLTLVFTSAGGVQLDTLTNTNGLGAGAYHGSPQCIRAKAATTITLATTGTFTTVTYNVEGVIRQVSGTGGIPAATQTTNTQSLSGTLTLTNTSATYQHLNPNGANRTVTLPSSPTTGIWFAILNTTSANTYTLTVNNASSVLVTTIWPAQWANVIYDGSTWQAFNGPTVDTDNLFWQKVFFSQQSRLPTTQIFADIYNVHATDFTNLNTGASVVRRQSSYFITTGTTGGSNIGWDLGASYSKILFIATVRNASATNSSIRNFITGTLPNTNTASPKSAYYTRLDITAGSTAFRLQKTTSVPAESNIAGDGAFSPNGVSAPDMSIALYVDGTNDVQATYMRMGGSQWASCWADTADTTNHGTFRYVGITVANPSASAEECLICPVVVYAQ